MLRNQRTSSFDPVPARVLRAGMVIMIAMTTAGCSAGLGRFDFPTASHNDRGRTSTASIPVPSEPIRRNVGIPIDREPTAAAPAAPYGGRAPTAYDGGIRSAGLPEPVTREAQAPAVGRAPPPRAQDIPSASPNAGRVVPTAATPGGETIEVKAGDTLYRLSRRHRVSIDELKSVNGLQSVNLKVGQKLVLPGGRRAVATRAPITPTRVASAPSATAPAAVPAAAPAPAAAEGWNGAHTVAAGESLYAISRRYNVKVAQLQSVNQIADARKVRPGTILRVPGGGSPVASSPSTHPRPVPSAPPVVTAAAPAEGTASDATPRTVLLNPGNAAPQKQVAARSPSPPSLPETATVPPIDKAPRIEPTSLTGPPKFRWPAKGRVIEAYGARADGSHNDGINISVPQGTDVLAAESGVVTYLGNELAGYGNLILVRHDNGWVSAYAHNDSFLVARNDKVRRGQPIAKAGKTGHVDQPQIHFELRNGAKPVDPMPLLEKH